MLDLGEGWEAEVRTTQVYRLLAGYQKAGVFPENIDLVSGDRILECRMGIFHDSYSARPGAMAVLTDVTEIRTLRSRLEEREKLAVVGRLSATMAHEIRNPLASISGAAQVIRTGTLDEAGTARMVEMIIGQSRRASDIIEGYLEVARGGRMREETELRLDRLISVVVEGAARSYGQNIDIVLHPMPEVTIRGKEQRLTQIFENLLRNSAEAIGSLPDGRMDVELTILDDEKVRVSMRDNGPGMPAETLSKASEPFFTTKEFGTGLGLYVARRVVEEHDGTIRFVTPEGGGLEVIVELPVSGASE
jgi:signal transduction histidine kinase